MGKNQPPKRVHDAELYVDPGARPGWPTAAERLPAPGAAVYVAAGPGVMARVCGRTSDGGRMLEIRLDAAPGKPYFAAASNVLVAPAVDAAA